MGDLSWRPFLATKNGPWASRTERSKEQVVNLKEVNSKNDVTFPTAFLNGGAQGMALFWMTWPPILSEAKLGANDGKGGG